MADRQADLPDPYILGDSWGLGWIRFGWDGHRLIGHDGNTIGQAAFLRLLPEQGLAVTLLTNGGQTRDLYEELFREVFEEVAGVRMPAPLSPPEEPVDVDPSPFLGTYERASVRLEVLAADAEHPTAAPADDGHGHAGGAGARAAQGVRHGGRGPGPVRRPAAGSARRGSRSPSTRCPRASATCTSGPGPRAAWTDEAADHCAQRAHRGSVASRTRPHHPSGRVRVLRSGAIRPHDALLAICPPAGRYPGSRASGAGQKCSWGSLGSASAGPRARPRHPGAYLRARSRSSTRDQVARPASCHGSRATRSRRTCPEGRPRSPGRTSVQE